MTTWFWYAVGAAILYGLHQAFTKLAADQIGEGWGGFVIEARVALRIGVCIWGGFGCRVRGIRR